MRMSNSVSQPVFIRKKLSPLSWTVYGEVQGGYDYETQIGGSNYVAHVEGEIIE
jgi:hypothetical protein